MTTNKALIFKNIPDGYPIPGKDLTIESGAYGSDVAAPKNGIVLQSLYSSFDPYMRSRMRPASAESYVPAFALNEPIEAFGIGKVLRSDNASYKEGELVTGIIPVQEYIAVDDGSVAKLQRLQNPLDLPLSVFLGALGMPGLTAYSSLYKIGKPRKGETIFISAASGAVGQVVGQLAKVEGLRVIGSVGSDEKLEYILKIGFDGGFNYKKESPGEALARLAPGGVDIYYDNVGGEHLEAALEKMNVFGRVVLCGLISQYNSAPYPIRNLHNVLVKRLEMRGFIVADPGFGDVYMEEFQKRVQPWIKDGTFKVLTDETVGIDNAAEGFVGLFHGKNMGKAVLKF